MIAWVDEQCRPETEFIPATEFMADLVAQMNKVADELALTDEQRIELCDAVNRWLCGKPSECPLPPNPPVGEGES